VSDNRAQWGSKVGFILAASGSAIGLGNIVFFSANAYTFGAGAFYLPYLAALFVVGIPVLILEMGLGGMFRRALPAALGRIAGHWGEVAGWFALLNASFISMYYLTILAWVGGMLIGSFGPLWEPSTEVAAFGTTLPNPVGFFFRMLSSWGVLLLVAAVWVLNLHIVRRGVATIEGAVRVFVPLMWIFMIVLIVRGLTLPHGTEGVALLFTPDFSLIGEPRVWQGAFGQIFFSLSLGFGIMTAYSSFLPKDADHVNNGIVTACMNCGFEYIAGLAVFSLLVAFAIVPQASTIGMMFFVVPQGIAAMPVGVRFFGVVFFVLLLFAGLSSSVSLVESIATSAMDKFRVSRRRVLALCGGIGFLGSVAFALPTIIDRSLSSDGTLGLTLIDLIDHWAFNHGLLAVGLIECLIVGWMLPVGRLREAINRHSRLPLPAAFDWLVKLVIPIAVASLLVSSVWTKLHEGLYGNQLTLDWGTQLPLLAFLAWIGGSLGGAIWLARQPQAVEARAEVPDAG
jgi:NSS family neurotransmitter:Na+ symporter